MGGRGLFDTTVLDFGFKKSWHQMRNPRAVFKMMTGKSRKLFFPHLLDWIFRGGEKRRNCDLK